MAALYSTSARVTGGREGHARSDDGLLDVALAIPKELGGAGGATNPEQLFAAGYAACFESALRHIARQRKYPLKDAAVTAHVELDKGSGDGFFLGAALHAEIIGLSQADAETLVAAAHEVCPYSNATRGNIDVAISVTAS